MTQIVTRMDDQMVAAIDELVADGTVVSRSESIPARTLVVVAPVSRTIRSIATEIRLGAEDGLNVDCVATFDNLRTVRRSFLTKRMGSLDVGGDHRICRALAALADC